MINLKKIISLLVFVICFSFTSIAQENLLDGPVATIDYPNYAKNIEIVKQYVQALNNGNAKKANAMFHDQAIILGLSRGNDTLNKQGHLQYYNRIFTVNTLKVTNERYLPLKTENNNQAGNYEWVFTWSDIESTLKGTKKSAKTRFHGVATIADGKITSLTHYYDTSEFIEMSGYKVVPIKD